MGYHELKGRDNIGFKAAVWACLLYTMLLQTVFLRCLNILSAVFHHFLRRRQTTVSYVSSGLWLIFRETWTGIYPFTVSFSKSQYCFTAAYRFDDNIIFSISLCVSPVNYRNGNWHFSVCIIKYYCYGNKLTGFF